MARVQKAKITVKRVYDNPKEDFGIRVLVDRLWPRGLSKKKADVDLWLKEAAPSTQLRKWFGHDEKKWREFKKRYYHELNKTHIADKILKTAKKHKVILLYGAKDQKYNNAVALKEYLKHHE